MIPFWILLMVAISLAFIIFFVIVFLHRLYYDYFGEMQ